MRKLFYRMSLCTLLFVSSNLGIVYGESPPTMSVTEEIVVPDEGVTEEGAEEGVNGTTEDLQSEETVSVISDIVMSPTETISSKYCINNWVKSVDYKLDSYVVEKLMEDVPKTDIEESVSYNDVSRNLNELSVEESWLISNNIISRAGKLDDFTFEFNSTNPSDYFTRSELWMALAKTEYGVINSRPLLFRTPRNPAIVEQYTKSDGSVVKADGSKGDYCVYVTPNVYELYFSMLLDKGLLNKGDFTTKNGMAFLEDYNTITKARSDETKVEWVTSKGLCNGGTTGVFGYSTKWVKKDNAVVESKPNYFREESMYTMDALKVVESFLRASEKEMSELEASVVAYKYGINYVDQLSDVDKKTVEFLIAKGVLNYEDPNEVLNIYGDFTRELAYKVLYRVANPEARFDFSKIQLTDQESFWQEKGFYLNHLNVYNVTDMPEVATITSSELKSIRKDFKSGDDGDGVEENQYEDNDSDSNFFDDSLSMRNGWFDSPLKVKAEQKTLFKVIKMFDTRYKYKYDGTNIKDLSTGGEIAAIEDLKTDDKKVSYKAITFSVSAKDSKSALNYVNNKITADMSAIGKKEFDGYTTIESETGVMITMVSEASLQSLGNISILEDKLLLNNTTGAEAILLPDSGYALVGNQVIVSDTLMVTNSSGEIYYNLDVISALLENATLKELTTVYDKGSKQSRNSIYVCSNIKQEKTVKVKTGENVDLGKTTIAQFSVKEVKDDGKEASKATKRWYYNLSQLDKGINSLVRQYRVKVNGDDEELITFIVDWQFIVLSGKSNTQATAVANSLKDGDQNLTIGDVNKALYSRPTDASAALWWDSNISISNSLANFMYGTTGVRYVTNGYLAPSFYVLKSKNVSAELVDKVMKQNGFALDKTGKQFCNTTQFWKTYYENPVLSDPIVLEKAKSYRHFAMLDSVKAKDGLKYSDGYFLTNYNVLYRSVKGDDRVQLSSDKLTLEIKTKSTGDRTKSMQSNAKFNWQSREWVYLGMEDGFLVVMPNFTSVYPNVSKYGVLDYSFETCMCKLNGKVGLYPLSEAWFQGTSPRVALPEGKKLEDYLKKTGDEKEYYYFDGALANSVINAVKEEIKIRIYDVYFNGLKTPEKYSDVAELFGISQALTCLNKDYYYYGGTNAFVNFSGSNLQATEDSMRTVNSFGDAVGAQPRIYLPSSSYYFVDVGNGTKELRTGDLATAVNAGDVMHIGLNRTVIDSMVAKFSCVCKLEDLREGQKVYVGDVLLTKVGTGASARFVSAPIFNAALAQGVKQTANPDQAKAAVMNLFIGQTVMYSGITYSLTSYFDEAGAGTYLSSNTETGGVVWKDNKTIKIKDGDSDYTDLSKVANYACIEIKFSSGLLAQPMSADGGLYRLMKVSSVSGNDFIDNIPFYNESLTYARNKDSGIVLGEALSSTFQFFEDSKNSFKAMMDQAFKGDVKNIIWSIMFSISGYLCIMSWIIFFVLKYDVGRRYMRILAMPSSNGYGYKGTKGFDLIKIASCGIYNLESEPTLARTLLISFTCFFIMYSILHWIPR